MPGRLQKTTVVLGAAVRTLSLGLLLTAGWCAPAAAAAPDGTDFVDQAVRALVAQGRFVQAIEPAEIALQMHRAAEAGTGPAPLISALLRTADLMRLADRFEPARQLASEAVERLSSWPQAPVRMRVEAWRLQALLHEQQGEFDRAWTVLLRARDAAQRELATDLALQARLLQDEAALKLARQQFGQAGLLYREALQLSLQAEGREAQLLAARVRREMGDLAMRQGETPAALALYRQALRAFEDASPAQPLDQVLALRGVGVALRQLGRAGEAVDSLRDAKRRLGAVLPSPHTLHAGLDNALAETLRSMGDTDQAKPLAQQALSARRLLLPDTHAEVAEAFNNLGLIEQDRGNLEVAQAHYESATQRWAQHPARVLERAATWHNLASLEAQQGRWGAARAWFEAAWQTWRQHLGEEHLLAATTQNQLAQCLFELGEEDAAESHFYRAIATLRLREDAPHELGMAWSRLADMEQARGQADRAIFYGKQAVEIFQQLRHGAGGVHAGLQASLVRHRQDIYLKLAARLVDDGRLAEAQQVTALLKHDELNELVRSSSAEPGSAPGSAMTPSDQGLTGPDLQLHGASAALAAEYRALRAQALQQPLSAEQDARQAELGRQLRMTQRDYELYLALLADGLAQPEGRRGPRTPRHRERAAPASEVVAANPRDELPDPLAQASRRALQQDAPDGLALHLLAREARLLRNRQEALTAAEQARRKELHELMKGAREAFSRFIEQLDKRLGAERQKEVDGLNLKAVTGLKRQLEDLAPHRPAVVHLIALDDSLRLLLTTPLAQRAFTVDIGRRELNRLVDDMRRAVLSRGNVLPVAQRLHALLIAPLQAELDAMDVHTLMFAPTGTLRYLPFAALHDGQRWLVERYALSLHTEAARDALSHKPVAPWSVQAFGTTRAHGAFKPLPAVKGELQAIVGQQGLAGEVILDEAFTRERLEEAIEDAPVIHVASHFVFKSGSERGSFLLLGTGESLGLERLKELEFTRTELLALSACETALGGGANELGSEVEGFGAMAQNRGAKAVLATLWQVADQSTAQLMQRFYALRGRDLQMTKAQALQGAQLALLRGPASLAAAVPTSGASPGARTVGAEAGAADSIGARGLGRADAGADRRAAPGTAAAPYAHPFFWAPFVLMGNWL